MGWGGVEGLTYYNFTLKLKLMEARPKFKIVSISFDASFLKVKI